MFGIGLPELIVILALALIVVGPEKLPELARSLAKGMMELKKTANSLRDSIQDEMDEVGKEVKPWERLPHDQLPHERPSWNKGAPTTMDEEDQEPPLETEATIEEQQEQVILPEEESREHPGEDDERKSTS